jgi:hypothetical protein
MNTEIPNTGLPSKNGEAAYTTNNLSSPAKEGIVMVQGWDRVSPGKPQSNLSKEKVEEKDRNESDNIDINNDNNNDNSNNDNNDNRNNEKIDNSNNEKSFHLKIDNDSKGAESKDADGNKRDNNASKSSSSTAKSSSSDDADNVLSESEEEYTQKHY